MYRYRIFFLCLLIWFSVPVWGQLSEGGKPIRIAYTPSLKSQVVVTLPIINNELQLKKSLATYNKDRLKPFRFAEPIDVNLTPENSGRWIEVGKYKVWQLVINSPGAYSLNLIFDRYQLPPGARLFLFSPDQSDLIGAFTSKNNKPTKILATSPVAGDQLVVQYEEPISASLKGELAIARVNHDFVGIKSFKSGRRPLGISGSCNINVNCDLAENYDTESNAICRIIVSGLDLCTGALVNNTSQDGTPYIYTAGHCIDTEKKANESVFLFNYESPYCGEIDGDASHSLSGSSLIAEADSLDFSLVELGIVPPAEYRPYYLGWDHSPNIPDSSVCIHHPNGDVKKIAIDSHSPQISTFQSYTSNGFFLIGGWEEGTTEKGSSGAPLINPDSKLIGSVTGGAATCESPYQDYFARLNFAWDYYSQSNKQLKKWLDPTNSNVQSLNGFSPYSKEEACGAFTNFRNEDTHANIEINEQGVLKGYWSGNNTYGFQEFAEKFEQTKQAEVWGVSFGVGKVSLGKANSDGKLRVKIYEGDQYPRALLYSQDYSLQAFDEGVMNYLEFDEKVTTHGNFFVVYSLEMLEQADTFAVFQAVREVDPLNTFYIKDGAEWYTYQEKTTFLNGSALLMEVILCDVDTVMSTDSLENADLDFELYPNPFYLGQQVKMKFSGPVNPSMVQVFDLMGRQIYVRFEQLGDRMLGFTFSDQAPGNYFIKIIDEKKRYHARVVYLGAY